MVIYPFFPQSADFGKSSFSNNLFPMLLLSFPPWNQVHVLKLSCCYFELSFSFRYVKPPIFTLCVGNAWGEAALLLAAGAKGNRAALPSSTIMMKQVNISL